MCFAEKDFWTIFGLDTLGGEPPPPLPPSNTSLAGWGGRSLVPWGGGVMTWWPNYLFFRSSLKSAYLSVLHNFDQIVVPNKQCCCKIGGKLVVRIFRPQGAQHHTKQLWGAQRWPIL